MKAIVTGAAGFAGYSLTVALLESGYEVYAILKPNSEHNQRLKGIKDSLHLIECDCGDFDKLPEMIPVSCDCFYHLAWFGSRDDFDAQRYNIECTLMALESAAKCNCKRFVGIGSQAEYGICLGEIREDSISTPITAYGACKLAALYLTKCRAEQLKIEWVWGRIFSLYGDYEPKGRMLPDLVENLSQNRDMHLSSCEQNWDYLYVKDAAKAIIAIGESGHNSEVYNIAHGDGKALREYVLQAKEELNSISNIIFGKRANPFISLLPSIDKIKKDTGWAPEVPFEVGLKSYFNTLD